MSKTTKVVTGKVRLSYAHILAPSSMNGDDEEKKYSTSIIIPKSDKATIKKIKEAIETAKELGKVNKWGGKLPNNLKTPLRDGDEERPDDKNYKDSYFLNASSKNKPEIVDLNRDEILDKDEIYSGMFARVSMNFYPYLFSGSKGVAAGLGNIQKVADGDRLDGRSSAADDFSDDFEDDEDLI